MIRLGKWSVKTISIPIFQYMKSQSKHRNSFGVTLYAIRQDTGMQRVVFYAWHPPLVVRVLYFISLDTQECLISGGEMNLLENWRLRFLVNCNTKQYIYIYTLFCSTV